VSDQAASPKKLFFGRAAPTPQLALVGIGAIDSEQNELSEFPLARHI